MKKTAVKKTNYFKKIGKYLCDKRMEAGLKQSEVAAKMGYSSPQFISNFERGLCMPPMTKLNILVKLYRIDARELAEMILKYNKEYIYEQLKLKKV